MVAAPDVACATHVLGDRQRLRQVLLNLLSNAVKYNRDGGSVELACAPVADGRRRVEVTDTGLDIPPEALARLFIPFERVGAGPPITVLYIEDNMSNLRLVERILGRRPGVRLISAMRPELGLELAGEHHPDLVLLDLHLPDIPGETVLDRLQTNPRTAGIPVVILSADARPGLIQRLLDQGARQFLTKPLAVKELLEVLDAVAAERAQAPAG